MWKNLSSETREGFALFGTVGLSVVIKIRCYHLLPLKNHHIFVGIPFGVSFSFCFVLNFPYSRTECVTDNNKLARFIVTACFINCSFNLLPKSKLIVKQDVEIFRFLLRPPLRFRTALGFVLSSSSSKSLFMSSGWLNLIHGLSSNAGLVS